MNEPMDEAKQLCIEISMGNPGAITVLCAMIKSDPARCVLAMKKAKSAGITGGKLWELYKDTHNKNLNAVLEDLINR